MKNKANKKKYLLLFFALFAFITKVHADKTYEITDTTELYKKCNDNKSCIKICVYGTISSDYEKENWNAEDKSYIGYYYDPTATMKWEMGVLTYKLSSASMQLDTFSGLNVPKTDIYWEDYGDKTPWSNAEINGVSPYKNLSDNFECPQYFYVDDQWDTELCYANSKEKCDKQDELSKTDFGYARPLTYSFAEELKDVLNDTYNNLYFFQKPYPSGADPDAEKKIKFLAEVDPKFKEKYDSSKSSRENALNYCSILEEELKDEEKYFNSLGNEQAYRSIIDRQLQASATEKNVRNKEVYTDEILSSILRITDEQGNTKYRAITDPAGQNYIEKIHNIYGQNIRSSVNYVRDMCNSLPDTNIQYDEQKLVDTVTDKYETQFYDISIDKITEFNCGTLGDLADLVKIGYFIIEMVALVILVVFTVLDYAKVILSGEQDEMKKTNKRLATRLIIMVVLLLLPALINFVLGVFNIEGFNSENPLCVEIKNK